VARRSATTGDGGGMSEETRQEIEDHGQIFSMEGRGAKVEGIYQGFDMCAGYKGKGKQKSHKFQQLDGEIIKKRGFYEMDKKLENDCEEGQMVWLEYLGKDGEYHRCSVDFDDGVKGENKDEDGDL
tara:strand:- start:718 stop:1095 length:378 start_codon:yes stop_codon:yes gene_type:complete